MCSKTLGSLAVGVTLLANSIGQAYAASNNRITAPAACVFSPPYTLTELQNLQAATGRLGSDALAVSTRRDEFNLMERISCFKVNADVYKYSGEWRSDRRKASLLARIYANLGLAWVKISQYEHESLRTTMDPPYGSDKLWMASDLITTAERVVWSANIQSVKVKQARLAVLRQAKALGVNSRRPVAIIPDKKPEPIEVAGTVWSK